MAIAMQQRLTELNSEWRRRGIEQPFQARMGINTGYCNVGNFGSVDRMDYTIIGAEANLAARLEGIAEPGGIVISYETFALVSDVIEAAHLPPKHFKGIPREVLPYEIVLQPTDLGLGTRLKDSEPGYDLSLNLALMDAATRQRVRDSLHRALDSIREDSA